MTMLVHLNDTKATDILLTGGKGASLARLVQAGFPVPPGFALTACAYREFIQSIDLDAVLQKLNTNAPAAIPQVSNEVQSLLAAQALPSSLVKELEDALGGSSDIAYAVRSSSTLEDLDGAAFAGQHDSFLNCIGSRSILEKIKDCYISLWHPRAIAYRLQMGFDIKEASMAIVVQEMAECQASGVAFSVNPISGAQNEIVVDANWGLGESVVGGEAEIDHFVLEKSTGGIIRSMLGMKTRSVIAQQGGGTCETEMDAQKAGQACLTSEELGDLATLIRGVEDFFGNAQDIEWGRSGDDFVLLQSRPVTAVATRWTRQESAERYPNVITPLTWDFVDAGFHESLHYSFDALGLPHFDGQWFALFDHYVYGNQDAVEQYTGGNFLQVGSLEDLRALNPSQNPTVQWIQDLPSEWMRALDRYLFGLGALSNVDLEGLSLRELWSHIESIQELGNTYFRPNIAISIVHGSLCRLVHSLVEQVCEPDEVERYYNDLLAFCETKTGLINHELREMAGHIAENPDLDRTLHSRSSKDILAQDQLSAFPKFKTRFELFLRDHGHRELDFDMYQATWLEAPWAVLDMLRLLVDAYTQDQGTENNGRESELAIRMRQQKAETDFLGRLPSDLHFIGSEILRLARTYTSLDDLEHYHTTRLTLPMRKALRELGRRMCNRSILDDDMDIFFCRLDSLKAAIRTSSDTGRENKNESSMWNALGDEARARKTSYTKAAAKSPSWVLGQADKLASEQDQEAPEGLVLTGLPGSSGIVEGPVYIITSPDQFASFPSGSVLVARTTNPAWTPLFYSASAVITESGGPLSHGAVTAREVGIPAVMSARGCMDDLSNGEMVRVDGLQGKIVRYK